MGLRSTSEALAFVDELGPSATGELVVTGPEGQRGAVFVERGRVCWAAARGLSRRLTALLAARSGLEMHAMEHYFLQCRQRSIPLGEHLLHEGILSPPDLRAALLDHSLESVDSLCTSDARPLWRPRANKGYSPRFTFATSEMLAHAGARSHVVAAARIRPLLQQLFSDDEWGAAYVRCATSGVPQPVAVRGRVPSSSTALLRMGKWGASVLDVVEAFSPGEDNLFSVSRSAATRLVVFRDLETLVVGETAAVGRILNRRARERRAKGPS